MVEKSVFLQNIFNDFSLESSYESRQLLILLHSSSFSHNFPSPPEFSVINYLLQDNKTYAELLKRFQGHQFSLQDFENFLQEKENLQSLPMFLELTENKLENLIKSEKQKNNGKLPNCLQKFLNKVETFKKTDSIEKISGNIKIQLIKKKKSKNSSHDKKFDKKKPEKKFRDDNLMKKVHTETEMDQRMNLYDHCEFLDNENQAYNYYNSFLDTNQQQINLSQQDNLYKI